MTEEEAAKCWCPVSNVRAPSKAAGMTTCIGSRCMAWRLDLASLGQKGEQGHCGLAGPLLVR
jgi:hypothetical protein